MNSLKKKKLARRSPSTRGTDDDPLSPVDPPKRRSQLSLPLATEDQNNEKKKYKKYKNTSDGGVPNEKKDTLPSPVVGTKHEGDGDDEEQNKLTSSAFEKEDDDDRKDSSDPEYLPQATAVSPPQPKGGNVSAQGPIAVATQQGWLDWSNKRVRLCLLLVALVVCGVIAGVVTAVVISGGSSSPATDDELQPSSPTSIPSPTMMPSPSPTSLILEQVGGDIVELPGDDSPTGLRGESFFGWVVDLSSDGTRLAATSPYCQCVFIYDLVDSSWVRSATITDDTGVIDHMVLSGNGQVVAIGVPRNSEVEEIGGKVQVYQNIVEEGVWEKMGDPIYGSSPMDRIGGFVDDDEYKWLYADDDDMFLSRDTYDSSSLALSENGQVLAVGSAIGNYVLVFNFTADTEQWTRVGKNRLIGEEPGDKFGAAVDLSQDGSRIIVGAPTNIGTSNRGDLIYSGHVRVYHFLQNTDRWVKLGQDLDGMTTSELSPGFEAEQAGSTVSISSDGSIIAVGANKKAESEDVFRLGDNDGTVTMYRYSESRDEWIQLGNTINAFQYGQAQLKGEGVFVFDDLNFEKFPIVSRLSGDGKRVAMSVLAESLDSNVVSARGVVRLYELQGDVWRVVGEPIQGSQSYDFSGRSIAVNFNGSSLAIGSPQHNHVGVDDGQVRVFSLSSSTATSTIAPTSLAPTSTTPPTGQNVPVTMEISIPSDNEKFAWELRCDGMQIVAFPVGTYTGDERNNLTATVMVPDESTCIVNSTIGSDIAVYYGDHTSDLIVQDLSTNSLAFFVSPKTVSLTLFVQLDANPSETSWELSCDGVSYSRVGVGEELFGENELVQRSIAGVRDGAVCDFVIYDYFGDGICCSFDGFGFYRIYYSMVETSNSTVNLLAAGGQFDLEERVSFVASPLDEPMTYPPTVTPTLTPTETPLGPLVTLEVQIQLDDFPHVTGWQLVCDARQLALIPRGSYNQNMEFGIVTARFDVAEGASCLFQMGRVYGEGGYQLTLLDNDTEVLAQDKEFDDVERIRIVALRPPPPTLAPSTLAPSTTTATTPPNTFVPTITPAPTATLVNVTLVVFTSQDNVEWSLECNKNNDKETLVGNSNDLDYQQVAVSTLLAQQGDTCTFIITALQGICCGAEIGERGFYQVFFGNDISRDGIRLAQGGRFEGEDQVTFMASPEFAL